MSGLSKVPVVLTMARKRNPQHLLLNRVTAERSLEEMFRRGAEAWGEVAADFKSGREFVPTCRSHSGEISHYSREGREGCKREQTLVISVLTLFLSGFSKILYLSVTLSFYMEIDKFGSSKNDKEFKEVTPNRGNLCMTEDFQTPRNNSIISQPKPMLKRLRKYGDIENGNLLDKENVVSYSSVPGRSCARLDHPPKKHAIYMEIIDSHGRYLKGLFGHIRFKSS
nr:hypothetical protein [Tanacetum cinerariifolium]